MIGQRLVGESKHLLSHLLGGCQVVVPVTQHLRLDNRNKAVLKIRGQLLKLGDIEAVFT